MPSLTDLKPVELVTAVHEMLDQDVDYFALLGLAHGASEDEIKRTFVKLARGLHPDLPVFKSPELKARATSAFQAVTRAQMVLTDAGRRADYLQGLGRAPIGDGPQRSNPDLARIHVHRARQLVTRRDWHGAEESLRLANELFGDNPHDECIADLGWAIFNNERTDAEKRAEESKTLWTELIESRGESNAVAQAHYYMAIWCKLNGEVPKVKKHLKQCLAINDRHVEAKRELRLFERRRSSSSTRRPTGGIRRQTGATRRASGARRDGLTTGEHGEVPEPVKTGRPEVKKVPLKRRTSFLERLFGKSE